MLHIKIKTKKRNCPRLPLLSPSRYPKWRMGEEGGDFGRWDFVSEQEGDTDDFV